MAEHHSFGMKKTHWTGISVVLVACFSGATFGLVLYGNGATWERELPGCASARSACSLVHRRYWLSPLEIRLCRCPHKDPCPGGFETTPTGSAVNITTRTQLKICPAWRPPNCTDKQASLITRTSRKLAHSARTDPKQIHADVLCQCPHHNYGVYYQRTHGNNTADLTSYEQRQYFQCVPLTECKPGDPCGHVTRDFYATYRTCYCPAHHICTVPQGSDRKVVKVREAMYEDSAYQAFCYPK